jgi:hypothetical protein
MMKRKQYALIFVLGMVSGLLGMMLTSWFLVGEIVFAQQPLGKQKLKLHETVERIQQANVIRDEIARLEQQNKRIYDFISTLKETTKNRKIIGQDTSKEEAVLKKLEEFYNERDQLVMGLSQLNANLALSNVTFPLDDILKVLTIEDLVRLGLM